MATLEFDSSQIISGTPTTGGSMAADTYFYALTAVNGDNKESPFASNDSSGIVVGGGNNAVDLTWTDPPGADTVRIYRSTTNGVYSTPSFIVARAAGVEAYTDTIATPLSGAPIALSITDVLTRGWRRRAAIVAEILPGKYAGYTQHMGTRPSRMNTTFFLKTLADFDAWLGCFGHEIAVNIDVHGQAIWNLKKAFVRNSEERVREGRRGSVAVANIYDIEAEFVESV